MLIDVVVLAFIWIIVARGGLLFKTTVQTTVSNACISHALASAARAASFSRATRKLTPPPIRTRSSRLAIALRRWIGHNTSGSMPKIFRVLTWTGVAALGAFALATIALRRGEQINAMWLVVAAFCTYALGYRFYSKFIAAKVLALDGQRATPAERLDNGRDFVPTNKWVVFGHHFAAIAGPGPLVGPVLPAQFGYLPGTLWILAGAVFGGCVQDFVILLLSGRRDGKSLSEMAREVGGKLGGIVAYVAIISIIVILLAVCALVVVNALKNSPWGTFTIAMTIPIALLMGMYLRRIRPGKVLEVSALGFVLVLLAILGGQWVSQHASIGKCITLGAPALAMFIIIYGFAASAVPVWLLLAPRD